MLEETFGLVGTHVVDPRSTRRDWILDSVYAPIHGRQIGGIRVHATDQKGFASFINQRDLEVLLGIGQPGEYCRWLGKDYVDPLSRDQWIGFVMDEEDLRDDLFAREQELRFVQQEMTGAPYLPADLEIFRLIHLSDGVDCEELLLGLGDQAVAEPWGLDIRINTIDARWLRAERRRAQWIQY